MWKMTDKKGVGMEMTVDRWKWKKNMFCLSHPTWDKKGHEKEEEAFNISPENL